MKHLLFSIAFGVVLITGYACTQTTPETAATSEAPVAVGQSGVADDVSQKNIADIIAEVF